MTVFSSNVQPKRRVRPKGAPWHCLCVAPNGLARLNRGHLRRCLDCGRYQHSAPNAQATVFRVEYGDRRRERAELRCACGYGIVVSDEPPTCPMCQANAWQRITARPEAA